jgi:phytoene dehydrogenase-like protein
MRNLDFAVVGSGIGGSIAAALNQDKETILFERDKNLGGCASTFKKYGNYYNTGATTLAGYEEGHVLKKQFDTIGVKPNIEKSDIAIRVVQNYQTIDRTKDFEDFLDQLNKIHPHPNNRIFWTKMKEIDTKFWQLKNLFYGKYSTKKLFKSTLFVAELFKMFGFDIFKSADSFIHNTLYGITNEYKNFIDAGLLITVQSDSKDISLLSLALGLSYPFHDVFYVNGGMSDLIKEIVKNVEVKAKEEVQNILKDGKDWIVETNKDTYKSKKVILNSTIYQSGNFFKDEKIQNYYNSFAFNDQSAFVIYLTLDSKEDLLEHYQFIYEKRLPNCISNSFFVSFSKKEDEKLSKNGYSVTISTHTKAHYWTKLSKEQYEIQKEKTMNNIIDKFLQYFQSIKKEQISQKFSATSFTFNRYINRYNCGGNVISIKNIKNIPSCDTPFDGLFNVGDTIFAGQGWPGVSMGVEILQRQLHECS